MRMARGRARTWLVALLWLCGCGGKHGTLQVHLVLPVGDDPFADAQTVHVKAGSFADQTATVSGGHFDLSLSFKPASSTMAMQGAVLVEAIGAGGTVVGRGESPQLGILPQDEDVWVLVARVGRTAVVPTDAMTPRTLAKPRSAFAAAAIPRLGPAFVGGVGADGKPATDTELLQLYRLKEEAGASLSSALPGTVAIAVDRSDQASGYLLLAGGAASSVLLAFDPLSGASGLWQPVSMDASLARDDPASAMLADGSVLLSGGSDAHGAPLQSATLITTANQVAVSPITAMMLAARAGHTATAAHLTGGDGVLLFGGNPMGGPDAEGWLASSRGFVAVPLSPDPGTRTGHAAVARSSGNVLIVGGADATGKTLLGSALDIDPQKPSVTVIDPLLKTPRRDHTATVIGGALVVCGGTGADGMPIADCEIFDEKTLAPRGAPVPLATARTRHVALSLETGVVLLAGGQDAHGAPIASFEIYTP